jgi:hypothetical protein
MKGLLKLLARLYPSSWRERYGEEYEALLEDVTPHARDLFDVFWGAMKMQMTAQSFVRIVLPCALAGGILAFAISFARPALYRSQTLILVNTDDRQSIDNQLRERLVYPLNRPFLASVVQADNLYPKERVMMPMNDVVKLMRKNIEIRRLQTSDGKPAAAFVLRFDYPDPIAAQRVDQELVSGLVGANLRATLSDAAGASRPRMTFSVRYAANLPETPFSPDRREFSAAGLIAGLLGGLIVAALAGWRRSLTVANG